MSKISIITINYNNAEGLLETIVSVVSQTYSNLEYIVIDGDSTDESVDIIKKNETRIDYWVSERDSGIYDAINKGIAKATGEYLIFMNSGDCFYHNNVVKTYKDYVIKFPKIDIFYSNIKVINDKAVGHDWVQQYPDNLTLDYFKKSVINHQATLIKASIFKSFGVFPLKYKLAADYWLWIISLLNNKKFKHIDAITVKYDNSGISATKFNQYAEEMDIIWHSIIPDSVQEIILENKEYKRLTEFKIVKAAIALNKKFQALKQMK